MTCIPPRRGVSAAVAGDAGRTPLTDADPGGEVHPADAIDPWLTTDPGEAWADR